VDETTTGRTSAADDPWHRTACILCSINCGLEVQAADGHLTRIRGDKAHPASRGYTCEKPRTLDLYQNARDRLDTPMRRRSDGTYEPVDWDTAIREIAERFLAVASAHGGESIFYYGGGGQGNHLGGAHAAATRAALGATFSSNALAQEKTGEFWVDGRLFGRPRCHTAPDLEHAEVAVFLGKNPWQSHGFPRARVILKEIAKDPGRTLVVIDPRRSETAEMADVHLAPRPGTDVWLLSALLAVVVEEDLYDHAFVDAHCTHAAKLFSVLASIDVARHCERCGVPEEAVRGLARRIGAAASVSIFEDLGIQQAPFSTLNSYLEKLVYLLTGNFARRGGMNLHTRIGGLGGGGGHGRTSPVTGSPVITGLIPANVIPDEILTDHPRRFRAMLIESANPVHSLADSARMREALRALDCVVVIDVAMTETAREADYVLPAASQLEKWESTFFTLEFPHNVFHLRAPVFEPRPGTLPEPEIHRRLVRALGALDAVDLSPLTQAAAEGLDAYAAAFLAWTAEHPTHRALSPIVLYETLGPHLPDGAAAAAVLWGAAQTCALAYPEAVRRAGFEGEGPALGNALFRAVLAHRSGVVFSVDEYEESLARVVHDDGRIDLWIPELIEELAGIDAGHGAAPDAEYPFVLSAGERRSTTANTIYRDPDWRRKDADGALRIHPEDAARLGLRDGDQARIRTRRGACVSAVEVSDRMQPGHVSLPNGLGLSYPDALGEHHVHGVAPNELTDSTARDWLAGTPWHKHVPARIEPL
jgi:formate dehydrogenase